jgi:Zn-finger nucleic acid-binding protein
MVDVEYSQIELDYCAKCEGVWFDAGELNLFLQSVRSESPDLTLKNIVSLPETRPSHKHRKCPICRQEMKETAIGEPAVHIDVCRQGDGLWFDGGEVHQLLRQLAQKPSSKESSQQQIITFLGEVFKAKE